jgi:pimeloyl-ACP methyl ester carboxylesterase
VLIAVALLAACGDRRDPHAEPTAPAPAPATEPARRQVQVAPAHRVVSEEVSFTVGGRAIPATLTRPDAGGVFPGVVLLAGSGPTDRDWESPLLPGDNGSGRLLAEELTRRGAVVVRFDKAGAGANPGPPFPEINLDTFRDEARGALGLLRGRDEVDPARLFLAGHSEGGIHATRAALAEEEAIAGLVQLAGAGRPMKDVIVEQLEGNFRDGAGMSPLQIDQQIVPIRRGIDDFLAGRPVDATKISELPPVQQLFTSLFAPHTERLARPLLAFDPAAELAKVAVPVLVVNGAKDVQVSAERDAARLAEQRERARKAVALQVARDADHVLKHEPREVAELHADLLGVQNGYNAPGRTLDPEVVRVVAEWLAERTK